MKQLCKNLRNNLYLIAAAILLIIGIEYAKAGVVVKPVAIVSSVVGNAFLVKNGETKTLSPGNHIYNTNDIITEEGSQVSITDYFDHKIHLASAGQIKISDNVIELKRGYLWIQSHNKSNKFFVKTVNAKTTYLSGEVILSFDLVTSKTQILSITGMFEFANLYQEDIKLTVADGQFSFIDNEYEKGTPRNPTPIGFSSYKKVTGLFHKIKSIYVDERTRGQKVAKKKPIKVERSIASADPVPVPKIKYKEVDLDKLFQEKLEAARANQKAKKIKHMFSYTKSKKSHVPIKIYGSPSQDKARVPSSLSRPTPAKKSSKKPSRSTSSIGIKKHIPYSAESKVKINTNAFEDTLLKEYKKQLRHSDEVNSLINELKSYDQDYKKNY